MRYLMLAAALLAAVFQSASAQAPPDNSASVLEGLWAAEVNAPVAHGELVLTRSAGGWTASLAGADLATSVHDGEIIAALRDNQGSFRGALRNGEFRGFWTQPAGFAGQAYATPIAMHASRRDVWHADVQPLEQSFHLYLQVFRDTDGRWLGAFRNPEANFNGGASRFTVSLAGGTVQFRVPDNDTAHDATLLRAPDRLRLQWPPLSGDIEFSRVSASRAGSYFPRAPESAPYVYAPPLQMADGWSTTRARDAGMDEAALATVVQRIIDVDPSTRRPSLIHSILIAHRGRLVFEEYFYGFDRETPHDVRSAAKTFGSVMLGAAMQQGAHISPQTPVYALLSGMGPFANSDPRKARLTLAHLMTESSGLACDDYDDASPGAEGNMQGQTAQPNWWRYTLDLPLVHEPGERYAYCSANTNLIGAALRAATRTPVVDFFDRSIARPLQFGAYHWNLMPNGEGYLGGGVQMRPRDLLKIGQLYLNGGVWNGRRIVSRAWVQQSTAAIQPINEQTTGRDADSFANSYLRGADGYAWHRYGVRVGDRTVDEYEANGNGGQLLVVVPEYDLAVVMTGGNFGQGGIWLHWRDDIIGGQIIPEIRR